MEDQLQGAVVIERRAAQGPFVFVCEHAVNAFPAPWGDLGLSSEVQSAHVAWDPGALGLARGLAERLDAPLVRATTSRLIYDLNRPPQSPGAMPARSEIFDIPGNAALDPAQRLTRTQALYLPFHAQLRTLLAEKLALGQRPILVTVHSFTPVYHGRPRAVELGIIHDADPSLACAVLEEARAQTPLDARLNDPYSAADEVTHTLALHATPMGLRNVMLELRNDLIADALAQAAMAARLAPVLLAALARLDKPLEVV
ncbi:N-formylglutamate amidohydrolase [Rhodobacter sp. TJ_12]|uniref:N-formylglutamate amidohydrolase n=1 Tax=Rhodobacter sp. TJ_12 TaxID=2029399 RepID=UPI001CC16D52|nr:N-formylglutamate amidohydrolase [Rhodobacter sp. TJ_12]MBZ4021880.1 N-formylglutamate amidohydrolase [Rhodobacter sp. TJ_12]